MQDKVEVTWVDVNEKLPIDGLAGLGGKSYDDKHILVTMRCGRVTCCRFAAGQYPSSTGQKFWGNFIFDHEQVDEPSLNIVAWAELPQGYKAAFDFIR